MNECLVCAEMTFLLDVFHFPTALAGLSGLKRSSALKGRVRRPEPVNRFLLVRENFARMH